MNSEIGVRMIAERIMLRVTAHGETRLLELELAAAQDLRDNLIECVGYLEREQSVMGSFHGFMRSLEAIAPPRQLPAP